MASCRHGSLPHALACHPAHNALERMACCLSLSLHPAQASPCILRDAAMLPCCNALRFAHSVGRAQASYLRCRWTRRFSWMTTLTCLATTKMNEAHASCSTPRKNVRWLHYQAQPLMHWPALPSSSAAVRICSFCLVNQCQYQRNSARPGNLGLFNKPLKMKLCKRACALDQPRIAHGWPKPSRYTRSWRAPRARFAPVLRPRSGRKTRLQTHRAGSGAQGPGTLTATGPRLYRDDQVSKSSKILEDSPETLVFNETAISLRAYACSSVCELVRGAEGGVLRSALLYLCPCAPRLGTR